MLNRDFRPSYATSKDMTGTTYYCNASPAIMVADPQRRAMSQTKLLNQKSEAMAEVIEIDKLIEANADIYTNAQKARMLVKRSMKLRLVASLDSGLSA